MLWENKEGPVFKLMENIMLGVYIGTTLESSLCLIYPPSLQLYPKNTLAHMVQEIVQEYS